MGVELIRGFHGEMDAILRRRGMTRGTVAQRVQALSGARNGRVFAHWAGTLAARR